MNKRCRPALLQTVPRRRPWRSLVAVGLRQVSSMGCGASKSPAPATEPPTTAVAADAPPKAAEAPPARSGPLDREALLKEVFAAMDADANGVVDINEFKATAKSGEEEGQLSMLFDYMDTMGNSDGKLQLEEWLSGMASLDSTDEVLEKECRDMLQVLKGAQMATEADAAA